MISKLTWYSVRYKHLENGKKIGAWHVDGSYEKKKEAVKQKKETLKHAKQYNSEIHCEIKKEIVTYKDGYNIELDDGAIHYINEV